MKRIVVGLLVVVVLALAAPANASGRSVITSPEGVTRAEYNAIEPGWTKSHIEDFIGTVQVTIRTVDDTSIVANYAGDPQADGDKTKMKVEYSKQDGHWVSQQLSWCVFNNLNVWTVVDTKS